MADPKDWKYGTILKRYQGNPARSIGDENERVMVICMAEMPGPPDDTHWVVLVLRGEVNSDPSPIQSVWSYWWEAADE